MLQNHPNSVPVRDLPKFLGIVAVLSALLMLVPCAGFAAPRLKIAPVGNKVRHPSQHMSVDRDQLVWPGPPRIARVRWLDQLTGEKVDWTVMKKSKKSKQGWMQRMAGTDPSQPAETQLPFQLVRTYGVAVDSKGNIYAADQAVGAVFIFEAETKHVAMIANGKQARFGMITGLAMDDNDRLFVADTKYHHIVAFNAKHEAVAAFGSDDLVAPAGMAIDTENRFLYVADSQKDQVMVFDVDKFKLLRTIGIGGKKHKLIDAGNFAAPTGVAVDGEGNLYVTDTLNDRVEIFDAEGKFIREFGKNGDGPGDFTRPKGIAIDGDGHVWVLDALQSTLQVFDREGQLLTYLGTPGEFPGQFQDAWGLTIDKANRVITSEQYPGRVQVFRYVTDAEAEGARKKQEAAEASQPAHKTPSAEVAPASVTPSASAKTPAAGAKESAAK